MLYEYQCTDPKCSLHLERVERELKAKDCYVPQHCESCGATIQRLFSVPIRSVTWGGWDTPKPKAGKGG